jgi:hypothetical protein
VAQLAAIDAGGAFSMFASDRQDASTLRAVHRFDEQWEAQASLQLRNGNSAAVDAYLAHGRVTSGDRTDMLHALFDQWAVDTDAGLTSAMIALDDATVRELNALAQAHHRDAGRTSPTLTVENGGGESPPRIACGRSRVCKCCYSRIAVRFGWVGSFIRCLRCNQTGSSALALIRLGQGAISTATE